MATKKKAAKKPAKKAAKKKSARKPNAAFMKPMTPDAALSAVVGAKPMPRTQVTKKLWDYIKKNGLQDKKNRRNINADEKLRPVFGGKGTVSMFEMTKLVNKHLK
jgi:chromatin remodeling complex protein RSC6